NRIQRFALEENPAFLRKPRFSRRDHDHLPGSRPPSRQGPARAGREDCNEIFCLVGGEADGAKWAHPRCQNHLRHPMAGPDAATSAVGWPSIFATPGGDGASPVSTGWWDDTAM